jgi:hypothetical protein
MLTSLKIDLNEPYKTGFAKKPVLQNIGLGAELLFSMVYEPYRRLLKMSFLKRLFIKYFLTKI